VGGRGSEANGVLTRQRAGEPAGNLRNADGFHCRQRRIKLLGEKRLDLFDSAIFKHRGKAPSNPVPEDLTLRRQHNALDGPISKQRRLLRALKIGQRLAGGTFDSERTDDALRIGDAETCGRLRVLSLQQCHASLVVQCRNLILNRQCNRLGNGGDICESLCEGIEVKPRTADENDLAGGIGGGQDLGDGRQPLAGREAMTGRDRTIEPVLGEELVFDAGAGGDDAQRVVDLHGVGIDDEPLPLLSARERQGRLAAGSRTRYQDGTPLRVHHDPPKVPVVMPVLSLIANPADPELDAALAAAVVQQTGGELNWLNHGVACDIHEPTAPQALQIARDIIGTKSVDANLIPSEGRKKLILVADMDSTMIEQECIDELAAALGLKDQVAEITDRAMRGELDFGEALDTRVALLKGLERSVIEEVRREAITLAPGGRALVQTMKAYGAYTSLVSGGFTFFADYFGKRIGFDEAIANVLEFDGDVLTGTVTKPIVDKNTKRERLLALAAERGVDPSLTIAVGDGANDLDMIRVAGFGVALHAKPAVAAEAGVRIDHGDLTALLYLQGYPDDDFVR
jgi:phosphoserine phosphatase